LLRIRAFWTLDLASGLKKIESGIQDKSPGSATLQCTVLKGTDTGTTITKILTFPPIPNRLISHLTTNVWNRDVRRYVTGNRAIEETQKKARHAAITPLLYRIEIKIKIFRDKNFFFCCAQCCGSGSAMILVGWIRTQKGKNCPKKERKK
jgi:hypothetical protein